MKRGIIEKYREVFRRLDFLDGQIRELTQHLESQKKDREVVRAQMEPLLREKLAVVENELRIANTYLIMAKRQCGSLDYRPTAENIPHSTLQRYFALAKGQSDYIALYYKAANVVAYWQLQRDVIEKQHEDAITREIDKALDNAGARAILDRVQDMEQQKEALVRSEEMKEMAQIVQQVEQIFGATRGYLQAPRLPEQTDALMCIGDCVLPFPLQNADVPMRAMFGDRWESIRKTLRLPMAFPTEQRPDGIHYDPFKLQITYTAQIVEYSYEIVRGIIYNVLLHYVPELGRVVVLDLDTFNPEYLGVLKVFQGSENMIVFPGNEREAVSALGELEDAAYADPEGSRKHRYLFVRGFGSGIGTALGERLQRICSDSRKNNISVIFLDRQDTEERYIMERMRTMDIPMWIEGSPEGMVEKETGSSVVFCKAPVNIKEDVLESLRAAYKPKTSSNAYESFFDLTSDVAYTRERKKITLPYAMDKDGNVLSMVYEGMEFASFIMGGSGSGKSTLIHALITGIVRNYHPDEVELWLADFKMVTFSKYIRHRPPHVKYILMDESPELIRDFVDKIYNEMLRRETALSNLGYENRRDLPITEYMPAIFVIFDEFSILSSVLSSDEVYRDRLQQIMVKGRATGFRFVFSSQKFTAGAAALTPTAREQIGSRLVMRGENQEMRDTLAIPGTQSNESIQKAIDTLPKYCTLNLRQKNDGTYSLDRGMALFFPGEKDEAWESRSALFSRLYQRLRPVSADEYDCTRLDQYVEKNPVIVNRSELFVFEPYRFKQLVQAMRDDPDGMVFDDDVLVSFGIPRRLEEESLATLTTEASENILLLAGDQELACGMSVLLSAVRSFRAQNCGVQVWAYQRNRMYHRYRQSHFAKLDVKEGAQAIWKAIDQLVEDIRSGQRRNQLIVLLGMENIINNFNTSSIFQSQPATSGVSFDGMQAQTEEEQQAAEACRQDEEILWSMYEQLCEKGEREGKSEEQIDKEFELLSAKYWADKFGDAQPAAPVSSYAEPKPIVNEPVHQADPAEALRNLIREGSQYGCHFLLCLNNFAGLKAMGVGVDKFNHRLSFKTDSADTSAWLFNTSSAFRLAEHLCQYGAFGSAAGQYSLSPYLHRGVTWDNWTVDENGNASNGNKK